MARIYRLTFDKEPILRWFEDIAIVEADEDIGHSIEVRLVVVAYLRLAPDIREQLTVKAINDTLVKYLIMESFIEVLSDNILSCTEQVESRPWMGSQAVPSNAQSFFHHEAYGQ